jgi:ATP-dependent RNA helicase HelY
LRDKVSHRTNSLSRTFDRIYELLTQRGYLSADGEVTGAGRMLARLWTEADLLVAECLRTGVWEGLQPHELAAAASVVLYEARREGDEAASVPRGAVSAAVDATWRIYQQLAADERLRGLTQTREPDMGFVWPMYRWAKGEPLAKVLASGHQLDGDMPAGDFVRWARQVIDLLGQISDAPGASIDLKATARDAMNAINRGVLAYSSVS